MVALPLVKSTNASLLASTSLVAVFVGGTSGICEYALRALVRTRTSTKSPHSLRIYIVGRNATAASKIIDDCKLICPGPDFKLTFVKAEDLSLLRDVDRVCDEIITAERKEEKNGGGKARIDWLCMSQSTFGLSFESRKDTKEGLDTQFSLLYYSRMRFATQLLPLLLSSERGAHITSIYAAGMEAALFPDDLSLRSNYGFGNLRSHAVYMKTLFMETLTQKHAGKLAFVHLFPGLVVTPAFWDETYPGWFRWIWWLVQKPVQWFVAMPSAESGERVLFTMSADERFPARGVESREGKGALEVAKGTDGTKGGGAYSIQDKGEINPTEKSYQKIREGGLKEKVWEHTMKAFGVIEASGVFKD